MASYCVYFLLLALAAPTVVISRTVDEKAYCYKQEDFQFPGKLDGFKYSPSRNGNGKVYIAGNVEDVLNGTIPSKVEKKLHNAKDQVGFGAAAFGTLKGLGELFLANGLAHVRTTDNESDAYFQTIRSPKYLSPFAIYVSTSMRADGWAGYETPNWVDSGNPKLHNYHREQRQFTLLDFYDSLDKAIESYPYCFYGLAHFSQMEGIAVSKAPIYGERLEGEALKDYYAYPPFQISNAEAIIFGCVANYSRIHDQALKTKLEKALYVNPFDSGSAGELTVHSHGLTVLQCPNQVLKSELHVEGPGQVYHLLSNSIINTISTRVFKLDRAEKIEEVSF